MGKREKVISLSEYEQILECLRLHGDKAAPKLVEEWTRKAVAYQKHYGMGAQLPKGCNHPLRIATGER